MYLCLAAYLAIAIAIGGCAKQERYTFTASSDGRIAYRHDQETGETWVSRMGSSWEKVESPEEAAARKKEEAARQEAARQQREKRIAMVEAMVRLRPDRLRKFAEGARVTVLSAEERETLRGQDGQVWGSPRGTTDPDTDVVWKLAYPVKIDGSTHWVDADKLALTDSDVANEDLALNLPDLWKARQQERRAAEAKAALAAEHERVLAARAAKIRAELDPRMVRSFKFGDRVTVLSSAPSASLRGRTGEIVCENDREFVDIGTERILVSISYQVYFKDGVRTVKAGHLSLQ